MGENPITINIVIYQYSRSNGSTLPISSDHLLTGHVGKPVMLRISIVPDLICRSAIVLSLFLVDLQEKQKLIDVGIFY